MEYADQIAGIIIGRVDRRGKETQLAQGIIRPTCNVLFDNNSSYTKSILLGDGNVEWSNDMGGASEVKLGFSSDTPDYSSVQFLSPDLIHRAHTASQGAYIQQHSLYKCDPYTINNAYTNRILGDRDQPARPNVFFKNITGPSTDTLDTTKKQLDGTKVEVGSFGVPLMHGAGEVNLIQPYHLLQIV